MLLKKLKIAGLSAVVLGGMMISQADAQTVTNTASKDKNQGTFDPYQDSNGNGTTTGADTASATFTFETASDLAVTKTVSAGPYYNDSTYTYTITVTNNGPSADPGVLVTDTLPEGMSIVGTPSATSGTPSTGTSGTRETVSWAPTGGLANGATETLTIEFKTVSNTVGTQSNDAFVDGDNVDNVAANDSNRVSYTVTPSSDVHLTKAVADLNGGNYQTGDTIEYTITISTVGPDSSSNQLITDVLPSEVTLLAAGDAENPASNLNGNQSTQSKGNGTLTVTPGTNTFTWAGSVGYLGSSSTSDVITVKVYAVINP